MKSNPVKTPPLPSPTRGGIILLSFLSLLKIYKRYTVSGNSMLPLLHPGDVVYTKSSKQVFAGDIVIANHPFRKRCIIKQVEAVHDNGVELAGLNADETEDSKTFGILPVHDIIGIVVAKQQTPH